MTNLVASSMVQITLRGICADLNAFAAHGVIFASLIEMNSGGISLLVIFSLLRDGLRYLLIWKRADNRQMGGRDWTVPRDKNQEQRISSW